MTPIKRKQHEVSAYTRQKADLKNVVAAEVQKSIKAGRQAGLTAEEAVTAAMIGVVSVIRVDCLNEEGIIKEVRRIVPYRHQREIITNVES